MPDLVCGAKGLNPVILLSVLLSGLGATPSSANSLLCARGSLRMGLVEPYGILNIEPRLSVYKAITLPTVLRPQPWALYVLN